MVVNKNNTAWVNRAVGLAWRRFPSTGICYLCTGALKHHDFFICTDCRNDLPLNDRACTMCALPVSGELTRCGSCMRERGNPVASTLALFRYVFPVSRLVHDLKFHAHIEIAGFLGRWIAQYACTRSAALPECFIPVPLHASRVRVRGYNQSLEIARAIGELLDVPVLHNLCVRTIPTPPQSAVSASLREKNIRGAFALSGRRGVLPRYVVLIDDVITTGATVNELARVLRNNGVGRVDVWAAARTEMSGA